MPMLDRVEQHILESTYNRKNQELLLLEDLTNTPRGIQLNINLAVNLVLAYLEGDYYKSSRTTRKCYSGLGDYHSNR